jgi:hypothetical protein
MGYKKCVVHDYHDEELIPTWWTLQRNMRAVYRVEFSGTHCKDCGHWKIREIARARYFIHTKKRHIFFKNKLVDK